MLSYTLTRGGAEQSILNILPDLRKRGVHVEVAALFPPHDLAKEIVDAGFSVHLLPLRKHWNIAKAIVEIVKLRARGGFNIIQCHGFYATTYAALAKLFLGKTALIATLHGLEFEQEKADTLWLKFRKFARIQILKRGFSSRVGVSETLAEHYAQVVGGEKISVIQNAFPSRILEWGTHSDRASMLRGFGLDDSDFIIGMVARLVPEKAHLILLEALEKLAKRGLKPKILCFGEGPLKSEIQDRIYKAQLEKQVFILNPRPQYELFPILGSVDLYVQPSITEGYGLALGEAMALGRPVLATRTGGVPELVKEAGVLIPPNDSDALAKEISLFMTDSTRRQQLGEAAKQRFQTLFEPGTVADQWVALYRQLISKVV